MSDIPIVKVKSVDMPHLFELEETLEQLDEITCKVITNMVKKLPHRDKRVLMTKKGRTETYYDLLSHLYDTFVTKVFEQIDEKKIHWNLPDHVGSETTNLTDLLVDLYSSVGTEYLWNDSELNFKDFPCLYSVLRHLKYSKSSQGESHLRRTLVSTFVSLTSFQKLLEKEILRKRNSN